MRWTEEYWREREETLREGMQLGMQAAFQEIMLLGRHTERRATIETLLRFRFGALDEQLSAIIDRLMALPAEEFTPLLLQLSREEVLARFA